MLLLQGLKKTLQCSERNKTSRIQIKEKKNKAKVH